MINMETIIKARRLHHQGLSVRQIAKQLNINRRTVAKYREQLNIPVARLRKEL